MLPRSPTFGADLGANATAVGASANVVILRLAEKAGRRITFWQFTKYRLVVTCAARHRATDPPTTAPLATTVSRRQEFCPLQVAGGDRSSHDSVRQDAS